MPAPRVTCLTPTVNTKDKLPYVLDFYESLLAQTMPDWEWFLICDHQEDYDALRNESFDPRVHVFYDPLTDVDKSQRHPIPVLYNTWYTQADGEFIFPAFDDDLLHPDIFKVFTEFFDNHETLDACYVTMRHQYTDGPKKSGQMTWGHALPAYHPRTMGMLDCQIDGGQACIRKSLLDKVEPPWWPEDAEWSTVRHCDGLMLEYFARNGVVFFPTGNPETGYLIHRFTPVSTFTRNTGPI